MLPLIVSEPILRVGVERYCVAALLDKDNVAPSVTLWPLPVRRLTKDYYCSSCRSWRCPVAVRQHACVSRHRCRCERRARGRAVCRCRQFPGAAERGVATRSEAAATSAPVACARRVDKIFARCAGRRYRSSTGAIHHQRRARGRSRPNFWLRHRASRATSRPRRNSLGPARRGQ